MEKIVLCALKRDINKILINKDLNLKGDDNHKKIGQKLLSYPLLPGEVFSPGVRALNRRRRRMS